jgi:signal-transduction protein with cAMP-binding, CBS, and nucleotidyltransferase domain
VETIMTTQVRDLMTADPVVLETTASARQAAEEMRGSDIGAVLVEENGTLRGIVTDRDLVARVIAAGLDASDITVGEVASTDVASVAPDEGIAAALDRMREHAVRRIPVVEDGASVGILAIGDLAVVRDPGSVLADISATEPNA